mmetsp:Transcript_6181/g.7617  ORF Transcript_6181/g.7617 Transcript_6181/m.7617 type:complete len:553 (-) Transcript_6181:311-1969(-)
MVVLSASISTKSGKALISRQFVEMTRLRVEGLLAAFPKLVNIDTAESRQHTFVETDSVRYVYQPLENQMYLLLITTKASNIVEDLGTLRLMAKLIPDVTGSMDEQAINDNAFELIFAFDEVLTSLGYRDDVTLSTIRTNLLMDSHEEKMDIMIKESKMKEAKQQMADKAKDIKERKMANLKATLMDQNGFGGESKTPGGMEGFGGGGNAVGNSNFGSGGYGDSGGYGQSGFGESSYGQKPAIEEKPAAPRIVAKKGMVIGANKKKDSLMAAMAAEDNLLPLSSKKSAGGSLGFGLGAPVTSTPAAPSTPLTLVMEEKIVVAMNREGGVETCEIKGTLSLTANTQQGALVEIAVNKSVLSSQCKNNWSFQTHPKIQKQNYEKSGILGLKKIGDGFPLQRSLGILRWSYGSPDAAPLTINCWPENEGSGAINVNVEFELVRSDVLLENVNILIPLGTTDPPVIESIDGSHKHDPRSGVLCWHHDSIDVNNSSGSLEFTVAGSDTDAFFPVTIMFNSQSLLCPIEVTSVNAIGGASGAVPNSITKSFIPESYQCA